MAFPTIPTVAASRVLTSTGTTCASGQTFPSLSSLTKNSGDLLIAIVMIYDGNSTNAEFSSWGGGFTEFGDFATTTTVSIGCAYKWSTGSETGTFTVTSADTSTNDYACFLLSIPGAHASTPPEAGGYATGLDTSADPGSLNPTGWGTEDTLWIAVAGLGETSTAGSATGVTAAPSGYSNFAATALSADAVGGMMGGVAFLQSAAASADPGTFTNDTSNFRWGAITIAVRPPVSYSLTCDAGSMSVTGTAAATERDAYISAVNGSLAITGTAATLKKGFYLLAEAGSLAVTGTAATTLKNSVLVVDPGGWSITGTDATLTKGGGLNNYSLTVDPGSFSIAGTNASLLVGRYLSAEAGSLSVTGTAASLLVNRQISAQPGSLVITGTAADLLIGRYLSGEAGSLTISGTAATLTKEGAAYITADPGSFSITGTAATLTYSGAAITSTGLSLLNVESLSAGSGIGGDGLDAIYVGKIKRS